jgi:RNA polymerase sigma-70 factor (ECF subfamily)
MAATGFLTVDPGQWQRPRIPTPSKMSGGSAVDPGLQAAVLEWQPLLFAMARRLCASEADARDVVQDVLESALKSGERLASVVNLRAWLIQILHRRVIDLFRRQEREPLTDDPGADVVWEQPQSSEPAWAQVTRQQLEEKVAELEPGFREVFVMHAFERLSYKQISVRLGIPGATVGTRLLRARNKLRVLLGVKGEEEGQ